MALQTFEIEVSQKVSVTIDDAKMTPAFMEEFREGFYDFADLEDHASHIAQMAVRNLIEGRPEEFVEGYGPLADVGVSLTKSGHLITVIAGRV